MSSRSYLELRRLEQLKPQRSRTCRYLWGFFCKDISEFAICHVLRHGNVNSIQNPSTLTNLTMELYSILLPLTLLCRTMGQIANWLLTFVVLFQSLTEFFTIIGPFTRVDCNNDCMIWYIYIISCLLSCMWFLKLIDLCGRCDGRVQWILEKHTINFCSIFEANMAKNRKVTQNNHETLFLLSWKNMYL